MKLFNLAFWLLLAFVGQLHAQTLLIEKYTGLANDADLSLLKNSDKFKSASPDSTSYVSTFSFTDSTDGYGIRALGKVSVDVAGNYIFSLESSAVAELHLSTDASPTNKVNIATLIAGSTQTQSAAIALEAGKEYYIEALMKDAVGADTLTVKWSRDGGDSSTISTENLVPIDSVLHVKDVSIDTQQNTEVTLSKQLFESGIKNNMVGYLQNDQGLVVFEAEEYHKITNTSNKAWTEISDASALGGKAMDSAPDTGITYDDNSGPRLDYLVNFVKTGTHYVWVKGRAWPRSGTKANADSVHIGLNGALVSTSDRIKSFYEGSYNWSKSTMDGARATINITQTGAHFINAFVREDGFILDRIVITTDPNYVPADSDYTPPSKEFTNLKVLTLPYSGSLKLNGVAVTEGQVIPSNDLPSLSYTPGTDYTGTEAFVFTVQVGNNWAINAATVQVKTATSGLSPRINDFMINMNEMTSYNLSSDITSNYTDPDNHVLQKIMISKLPANGALSLGEGSIVEGQEITDAELANLIYTPTTLWSGIDTFQLIVTDSSGAESWYTTTITLNVKKTYTGYISWEKYIDIGSSQEITGLTSNTKFLNNTPDKIKDISIFDYSSKGNSYGTRVVGKFVPEVSGSYKFVIFSNDGGALFLSTDDTSAKKVKIAGAVTSTGGVDRIYFSTQRSEAIELIAGREYYIEALHKEASGTDYLNVKYEFNGASRVIIPGSMLRPANTLIEILDKNVSIAGNTSFAFTKFFIDSLINDNFLMTDDAIKSVKILSLPSNGQLQLNGEAVIANQLIDYTDIEALVYLPAANFSGVDTFKWTATSGNYLSADEATLTIKVDPPNNAPLLVDFTVTTDEDTAFFFTNEFNTNFTDLDQDTLAKVTIVSLPEFGLLTLNDEPVKVNDEILLADLGSLKYEPMLDRNGTDTFTCFVTDSAGEESSVPSTLTINITPVNDAPVIIDKQVTTIFDTQFIFKETDFDLFYSDVDGDELSHLKVVSLPISGTLNLNGQDVVVGQEIPKAEFINLKYFSEQGVTGAVSFEYNLKDGQVYAENNALFTFNIITPIDDLLVRYDFEFGSNPGHDSSGLNNDAINHGSSVVSDPERGNVGYFNGGHMVANNFYGVTGSNPRTISLWVKSSKSKQNLLGWGGVSGQKININTSNGVVAMWTGESLKGSTSITDNKWHHIALVTYDSNRNNVQIYVDGRLEKNLTISGASTIDTSPDGLLHIGKVLYGVNISHAYLDDIRIYGSALDPEELANLAGHYNEIKTVEKSRVSPVYFEGTSIPGLSSVKYKIGNGTFSDANIIDSYSYFLDDT